MDVSEEQEPPAPAEGPGQRLRLGRENRGLSVSEVADALHLDREMIEAIEADDYTNLPPSTFTKGYLRAYARYLELNEGVLLASYERVGGREQQRPLKPAVGRASGIKRPGVRWVLSLLLLAAVGGGVALVTLTDMSLPAWVGEATQRGVDSVADYAAGQDAETVDGSEDASGEGGGAGQAEQDGTSKTPGMAPEGGGGGGGTAAQESADVATDTASSGGAEMGLSATPTDGAADGNARPSGDPTRTSPPRRTGEVGAELDSLLEGDPLAGDESLLPGDDPADIADDEASDEFGGPLGEAAPEPGRGDVETNTGTSPGMTDGTARPDSESATQEASSGSDDPAAANGASEPGVASAGSRVGQSDGEADVRTSPMPSADESANKATIELSFAGQSWMEIRDARGRRLLFELVTEFGERRITGEPPFELVVGDVDNVDVSYRGQAVDLKQYSRQGMARFELGGP